MSQISNEPSPGWYPDPTGSHSWRWWSGTTWTDHLAPVAPVAPRADHRTRDHLVTAEQEFEGWGKAAVWAIAIAEVVTVLLLLSNGPALHHLYVWYRQAVIDIRAGHRNLPPLPTDLGRFATLSDLTTLVLVTAEIVFCVWQYRAASVARRLGYPAKHSPGWGVAGWFIPIVNFWFPYQALRDCLPVGHPHRTTVVRMWMILLAAGVLEVATIATAPFSTTAAVPLVVTAGVLWAFYGMTLHQLVRVIGQVHEQAYEPKPQ